MSKYEFNILDWDTNFFNFKVAEINKDALDKENSCKEILENLNKSNVKLAYYQSSLPFEIPANNYFHSQYIAKRIPLRKNIEGVKPIHRNIEFYEGDECNENLIRLAQRAGREGRFGKDPNISLKQCDAIFRSYMENSINKKMASHILVYREEGRIVGFASLKIKKGIGYTPLFAVNREVEGQGVSFALMRATETVLFNLGCKVVRGGTQDLNKKALMVYKRFGLIPEEPEYIYHLWMKN